MSRALVTTSVVSLALLAFLLFNAEEIRVRVPILVYHNVRPAISGEKTTELFITPEIFEKQLKYLKENNFSVISMDELVAAINYNKKLPKKPVILTFDDSWREQYEYALPLLKKYEFKAIFYIWTDVVGQNGFMTWLEVKELLANGMEIGGHGKSHLDLTKVSDYKTIREEVVMDKKILEKELGQKIRHFAYPFATYNEKIISLIKSAGYASARGAEKGAYHNKNSLYSLQAAVVENDFNKFRASVNFFDFPEERNWMENSLNSFGPEKAYAKFKEKFGPFTEINRHIFGHMFGELLYEKYGTAGLKTCDIEFIFACYHGFLGRAISLEGGLEVLEKLDRECVKKGGERLGCHHGIGHGIISYLGENKLLEALETCASLSWKGPVGGCSGGLWMEYNFRNSHVPENPGTFVRELNPENPHEPCNTLPKKFQYSCYYEQPDWWAKIYKSNFTRVSELCDQIPNEKQKEFCFIGTGRIAAQNVQFDIGRTIEICERDLPEGDPKIFCRAGGFLSIYDYTLDKKHSLELCNLPSAEEKRLCLKKANLFGMAI